MILGIDASQANRQIRSGTEWYAFYLFREFKRLLREREDVTVRLYVRDVLQADLASLVENFSAQGGPATGWEVRVLRWPLKYFWGQVRLSWEMLVHPPDVLFCPAHTIPLLHPKKTFTTLHDVGFEDYPELYDWKSRLYHRWSARLAVRQASHIFTVSNFSKERIVENYQCSPEKLSVTHLGIDTNFSTAKNVSMGDFVLYVGRLEPKKNVLNLIKGYEMAEVSKELILAGPKINTGDIEAYLAERPKLAAKIKLLGYIEEERKRQLYQNAALFLFPTLYEGFGLPILEAQAVGIPVITSNTGSNAEVAGEGAVLVDPESPYEIAKAIKALLTNEKFREDTIKAGRENINRFSWQVTARKTLEIILSPE